MKTINIPVPTPSDVVTGTRSLRSKVSARRHQRKVARTAENLLELGDSAEVKVAMQNMLNERAAKEAAKVKVVAEAPVVTA